VIKKKPLELDAHKELAIVVVSHHRVVQNLKLGQNFSGKALCEVRRYQIDVLSQIIWNFQLQFRRKKTKILNEMTNFL
jgi:hypothetical protein